MYDELNSLNDDQIFLNTSLNTCSYRENKITRLRVTTIHLYHSIKIIFILITITITTATIAIAIAIITIL